MALVEPRDYYAQRRGGPRPTENLDSLKSILGSEILRLEGDGLFQWHLGFVCLAAGYVLGQAEGATEVRAYVYWATGQDLWPFSQSLPDMDENSLFTVIEFLHDHSATPTKFQRHDWNDCGIHVESADDARGRQQFRSVINRYLPRYKSGYELQPNGEVWHLSPLGLGDRTPEKTGDPLIDNKVEHAIATFRRRGATDAQKRDAVKNLADILELGRSLNATGLPSKDENRLFEIANEYGIRHHKPSERNKYDSGIWLDWIFYTFLNAVALMAAIRNREARAQDPPPPLPPPLLKTDDLDDLPF